MSLGAETPGGGVSLTVGQGQAFFTPVTPAAVARLGGLGRQTLADLQTHALALETMQRHLDELVGDARYVGVSWALIGWSLGLTAEGARKRWGVGPEDRS